MISPFSPRGFKTLPIVNSDFIFFFDDDVVSYVALRTCGFDESADCFCNSALLAYDLADVLFGNRDNDVVCIVCISLLDGVISVWNER